MTSLSQSELGLAVYIGLAADRADHGAVTMTVGEPLTPEPNEIITEFNQRLRQALEAPSTHR